MELWSQSDGKPGVCELSDHRNFCVCFGRLLHAAWLEVVLWGDLLISAVDPWALSLVSLLSLWLMPFMHSLSALWLLLLCEMFYSPSLICNIHTKLDLTWLMSCSVYATLVKRCCLSCDTSCDTLRTHSWASQPTMWLLSITARTEDNLGLLGQITVSQQDYFIP